MVAKPDMTRVWAEGAAPANVVDPDVTTPGKFDAGWDAEVPPFEHFNFLQQLFTQSSSYFNEQGIGVYDAVTDYPIGGLTKGSDGNLYQAKAVNGPATSVQDPVGDVSGTWGVTQLWAAFVDGGAADAYDLASTGAAILVPFDGMRATFIADFASTAAGSTVDFSDFSPGLPAKDIKLQDGSAVGAGDIDTVIENEIVFDAVADDWILVRGAVTQAIPGVLTVTGDGVDNADPLNPVITNVTLGVPQTTVSGTSKLFSSIPAGTKRITINFDQVSHNASTDLMVQLGDSGGIEGAGYIGAAIKINGVAFDTASDGFPVTSGLVAGNKVMGRMVLELLNSATNVWTIAGILGREDGGQMYNAEGSKALSSTLTQVLITTQSGTAVFDLGQVNTTYE